MSPMARSAQATALTAKGSIKPTDQTGQPKPGNEISPATTTGAFAFADFKRIEPARMRTRFAYVDSPPGVQCDQSILIDEGRIVFAVGIGSTCQNPAAAKALIDLLASPAAAAVMKSKGMDPA